MQDRTFNIACFDGPREELGDAMRKSESLDDPSDCLRAAEFLSCQQCVNIGSRNVGRNLAQCGTVPYQVDDGRINGLDRGRTNNDANRHSPVIGEHMLEVVVGYEVEMQIAVGHGQRDQGEVTEVPSGLLFRNLSEESAITVLELDVSNVNTFKGCKQRH